MKKALIVLAIGAATVAGFDMVAYFTIPSSMTWFARSYRDPTSLEIHPTLSKGYPRHYLQADQELGFDIARQARPTGTKVENIAYEIFSNDLGCFDRNQLRDFQGAPSYAYFAGDSYTWAYAPYAQKFAAVWEKLDGRLAAKCGVTHTGQRHQFAKFKRIAERVGKMPDVVVVGFFPNDPANDLAHPHSTVIGGYLVDTVYFRDEALVRPELIELEESVNRELLRVAEGQGLLAIAKRYLAVYSLSANILRAFLPYGRSDTLYNAFDADNAMRVYDSDVRATPNRNVVKEWSEHARRSGYRLVFILIPPPHRFDDRTYFNHVREWLEACDVQYLDLTEIFRGRSVDELYWRFDGHLSALGNQLVGEHLASSGLSAGQGLVSEAMRSRRQP